jgi:hypothetical protein
MPLDFIELTRKDEKMLNKYEWILPNLEFKECRAGKRLDDYWFP